MTRTLRRALIATGAVGLMAATVSQAAVAEGSYPIACAVNCAAKTEYQDNGDLVTVTDLNKDGHGAVGWIEIRQSDGSFKAFSHVYDGGGVNTYVDVQQDVLREASKVKIVSCLQDGLHGKPYSCGWHYIDG